MTASKPRSGGFARQPLALRRSIIEVLGRRDRLTALDLAAACYGVKRIVVCPARDSVSKAQLNSTRRALRALVAKGRVVALCRCRRWQIFILLKTSPSREGTSGAEVRSPRGDAAEIDQGQ